VRDSQSACARLDPDVTRKRVGRRSVLLATSLAVSAGSTVGAVMLAKRDEPCSRHAHVGLPASLHDVLPPHHQVTMALDLAKNTSPHRRTVLRELRAGLDDLRRDGLRIGMALGSTLFPPGTPMPRQLKPMPAFAGDVLDASASNGDVLVEVGGRTAVDANAAAGQRLLASLPSWRLKWKIHGLRAQNRLESGRALTRSPFHFTEGFGNPATEREIADRVLVRADQGEPGWAIGGSYQVVRIIQLATGLWGKDSVEEQERIIGRRRDGRWLDGTPVGEEPNFAADPEGRLTPLDSHVRLATPDRRNPPPLVRRSYSYDRDNGDSGLIFSCFQRDLLKGFEAVQKRLEGEAMAKYLLTTGGGYFFVPPPGDAWIDDAFAL
jgi:deferrochelatase/peroxidase EfeB